MSLATSVAGSTIRPQKHHAKMQQSSSNASQANINLNSNNTIANPLPVAANCMQQQSPKTPTSIKTSLSTSPIAANYMGSASLFSFESGLVLSGSSGCCSLSNSPSSSSSNSYLTSQSLENSCKKLPSTTGNPLCLNTSTSLEDSFISGTCQLNASLLAAVNGDLDDDIDITKSVADSSNQTETHPHTSESFQNRNSSNDNGQRHLVENMHNQLTQQSTPDSTCLNNEDARTLQLAVELTMMNFNQIPSPKSEVPAPTLSPTSTSNHYQQLQSHHVQHSAPNNHQTFSSVGNPYHMTTKVFLQTQSQAAATLVNKKYLSENKQDNIPLSNTNPSLSNATSTDERSKKSQNMTECVPVPSSEHVAEIVGRQGCKIKALRAKTNTYIKTPVRNEEPVFVVTGRKEDVAKAKREILSAAEHFTLIRATRRTNDGMNGCSPGMPVGGSGSCGHLVSLNKSSLSSTTPLPGQVTIQVRVPYRVVGLVVGPKGNTIKHIQHETQTYIVTPSRDKEPIFEVTGMPDNVQMARKQIEAHIATRTGNSMAIPAPPPPPPQPPAPAGNLNRLNDSLPLNQTSAFQSLNSLNQILNDDLHPEILSSIYKNGIGSALEYNQIGGNILNVANKSNTSNSYNCYMHNELNSTISSVNDIHRQVTISSRSTNNDNIQLNCNDFINNIMDSNTQTGTTQFAHEQNTNFSHLANNANAIKNLKPPMNSQSFVEITNNGLSEVLQQQNNSNTNSLLTRSCSSASSTASSSKSFNNSGSCSNTTFWKSLNCGSTLGTTTNGTCNGLANTDSTDIDEGIGEPPLYSWGLPNNLAALTNSYCSPTSTSISPTDSLFGDNVNNKTTMLQQQIKISSKSKLLEKLKRKICWMCHEKDILAALIPCGHTIFCSVCANRLCQQNDANCPICFTQIYQAIRVH